MTRFDYCAVRPALLLAALPGHQGRRKIDHRLIDQNKIEDVADAC